MWDVDGNKYFDFLSGESNELVADKSFAIYMPVPANLTICKYYIHIHLQPILL